MDTNNDLASKSDSGDLLTESRAIWDTNAEAWDSRIGSGGGWQTTFIAPTVERMLDLKPGERVLDIACGNGIFSRRMAELGAQVVAADFSPNLIAFAHQRTTEHTDRISYHVADATHEAQLLALAGPTGQLFDAVVCNMAVMDMPEVEPLFRAVRQLLKPGGRFVISVMHPCFNGLSITMQASRADYDQDPAYAIQVRRYLSAEVTKGMAIGSQPLQQYYWHRPLHMLFNSAFASGLMMDLIEEPKLQSETPTTNAFDWANYDMPPVLFARLRPGVNS